MIPALVYQQWLALRIPLLVAAAFMFVAMLVFAAAGAGEARAAARAALHVQFTAFAAIHMGLVLGGVGFLRSRMTGLPLAPHFTFSLPVGRGRIWAAWLALTWAAGAALLGLAFAVHAGVLLLSGGPVPIAAMAKASLLAGLGLGALLAVLGVVTIPSFRGGNVAAFLIWLLLWRGLWDGVVAFLSTGVSAAAIGLVTASMPVACACAWLMVSREEV